MRNHRFRPVRRTIRVMTFTFILTMLLSMMPLGGRPLLSQVLPPSFGPAPTTVPAPVPAPTRGRRQVRKAPTRTPTAAPAPTTQAEDVDGGEGGETTDEQRSSINLGQVMQIGGEALNKVIGDGLSDVVYGLTENGALYLSEDGGTTWVLMTGEAAVEDFVVSPANPLVLYAGQGIDCGANSAEFRPFLRSGDGGATWSRLPIGDNLVPLLAHPQETYTLFAADCALPYMSSDGGEQWQGKQDSSAALLWQRYRMDALTGAMQVGDLPASQANWHYLYAGGTNADGSSVVAYTGDMGDSWTRITPRISPEPIELSALLADPTTSGRLWFADANGIWHSDDFGASWLLMNSGLEEVLAGDDGNSITALALGQDDVVYVGTHDGLYHGNGVGDEWTPVEDEMLRNIAINQLLMLSSEPQTLWINADDGVYTYVAE